VVPTVFAQHLRVSQRDDRLQAVLAMVEDEGMKPKVVAGVVGIVLLIVAYLAGLAGCVYIGYLMVLALKKYVGG